MIKIKEIRQNKKKFISNSVEVTTTKVLFEAHYKALKEFLVINNV